MVDSGPCRHLFVTEVSGSASLSSCRPRVEIFGADNYSAVTASPHLCSSIFIPLWSLRPPCVNPRYPVWHPDSSGLIQLMKANTSPGARGIRVQTAENMSDPRHKSPSVLSNNASDFCSGGVWRKPRARCRLHLLRFTTVHTFRRGENYDDVTTFFPKYFSAPHSLRL